MPRAFMITHTRRFVVDPWTLSQQPAVVEVEQYLQLAHSKEQSELADRESRDEQHLQLDPPKEQSDLPNTDSRDEQHLQLAHPREESKIDFSREKMQSPVLESRAHLSSCSSLDSPPLKKRLSTRHRADGEKLLSCSSDVESDSGSSSHNEARGELLPELEYRLECPNNFSLLFELMTHSPQKNTGRDVLDLSCETGSPTYMSAIKGSGSEMITRDHELGEINRSEDVSQYLVLAQARQKGGVPNLTTEGQLFSALTTNNIEGVLKHAQHLKHSSDPSEYRHECPRNGMDMRTSVKLNQHQLNAVLNNNHHDMLYHAQRKISFDEALHPPVVLSSYPTRPDSPVDQPIDYSQLSSRRRDLNKESSQVSPTQDRRKKEEPIIRDATDHESVSPKFEFILSPSMDNYGNLVMSPPQKPIKRDFDSLNDNTLPLVKQRITSAFNHRASHYNNSHQYHSSTSTPISHSDHSADTHHLLSFSSSDKTGRSETPGVTQNTLVKRDYTMPYHPKLKYLLAASRFNSESNLTKSTHQVPYSASSPFKDVSPKHDEISCRENTSPTTNVYSRHNISATTKSTISQELLHSYQTPNISSHAMKTLQAQVTVTNDMIFEKLYSAGKEVGEQTFSPSIPTSLNISTNLNQHSNVLQAQKHLQSPISSDRPAQSDSDQLQCSTNSRDQQSTLGELLFSAPKKNGVDPYACSDCGKRYSTSSNLARHRQTHRSVCDKKARKCPHCDKVYVSMPAYSMHVRTHNQGCECPHCGKKFSRPWLLQGHIRTHTGEKPFACSQCGKSFADKSNLRAHIQTHSTEKPYVCGRCGKAFALKSYLYKHEESSCMRGQRFRP